MSIKARASVTLTRVNDGQGVESIITEYYLSTSKDTQVGGSWVTVAPQWEKGKYLWTRSKITYTNPTSVVYTKPICDTSWEMVGEVVEIVDGKNSIFYSTTEPSTTGKKENDVWFDTDDGYKMYKFSGGKWVATQFGTNAISSESITTDKLASGSITTGKIVAGAITSDQLASNSITADKLKANSITAGKIASNVIETSNLKAGIITTEKLASASITADKLDVDNLFVGDNAFIKSLKAVEIDASNITTGTINGERIDIKGLVSFEAFNSDLQNVFNFDVQGNKTYINGGTIATNTIKANSIDLLSGLTVKDETNAVTFAVSSTGGVEVNGLLRSGNFDENKNTGYQLSTDGKAILNQAVVKGDVMLPSAGMTNFGGQIGNENILKNTHTFQDWSRYEDSTLTDYNGYKVYNCSCKVDDSVKDFRPTNQTVTLKPSTYYTLSFWAKGSGEISSHLYPVAIESGVSSEDESTVATDGSIKTVLTDTWKQYWITWKTLPNVTGEKSILPCRLNGKIETSVSLYGVKFEEGDKLTAWCPHKDEQRNHVRIWAGKDFENRNDAPFKVYDSGDVYATNGKFSGKLYGDLDSGLVHIQNNEITIDSVNTFMDEDGTERSVSTLDGVNTPYLRFGAGTSFLNTDFYLGSESDKKVIFSNINKTLTINEIDLKIKSKNKSEGANVTFEANGNWNTALNIESNVPNSDAKLSLGYYNGEYLNTTIVSHDGSKGGKNGDICFRRVDSKQDIDVNIVGNITMKKSIKSSTQNIEMRSVANEGWGFFAV